jgi:hypothetical protein
MRALLANVSTASHSTAAHGWPNALEDAVYIDAGILVHCRESGEQVIRM